MKKTKLSIIAAAMLVLMSATGCGSQGKPELTSASSDAAQTAPDQTQTTAGEQYSLPNIDLMSEEITIMCEGLYYQDVERPELNGDVVNDAVFNRNKTVEEKLNAIISVISYTDGDNLKFQKTLESNILAGDTSIQLYVQKVMEAVQTAAKGLYMDWNGVPYVDFDKPWWNSSAVSGLSVAGRSYVIAGDIFIRGISSTSAILFNKDLFDEAGMEYPYELVRGGKWVYDEFLNLIKDKNLDLDGDGEMSIDGDRYGYITNMYTGLQHMLYTLGGHVLLKDSDDVPYIDFMSERTVDITEKAYDLFWNLGMYVSKEGISDKFISNGAYMFGDGIGGLEKCKAMEASIGIIPCPKYDEAQENYISVVDGGVEMLCIPITNDKTEATCAVAEALAMESYLNVTPAYFETAAKYKYTRDDDSIEMLDIIKNAGHYDAGYIFNPGRYGFAIMDIILNGNKDIASYIQKNAAKADAELESIIEGYTNNG